MRSLNLTPKLFFELLVKKKVTVKATVAEW